MIYFLNSDNFAIFNPFQANVPLMEKPGGWFLLASTCIFT